MTDPDALIGAYLDGALTEAEVSALNAWLAADRANLRRFTEALMFEEEIRNAACAQAARMVAAEFAAGKTDTGAVSPDRARLREGLRSAWPLAAAAALVILGAALWLTRPAVQEPVAQPGKIAAGDEWTVPTDALLSEAPTVARLSEEISELLQP